MSIPKNMQCKYDEIAHLIVEFSNEKLNDAYKDICLLVQSLTLCSILSYSKG